MKLTIAEFNFIHDAKVYLERGEIVMVDLNKIKLETLAKVCESELGIDVWFNVYSVPFSGRYCKLETDFSKRYISDTYLDKFEVITPVPFQIITQSYLLNCTVSEQRAKHKESVKWYKENIENPPKPLTFWQKVKQYFK